MRSREVAFVVFIVLTSTLLLAGCASQNNRAQAMIQASEIRKMMERQKAELAREEAAAKKVPELTAAGYEEAGDRYLGQGNLDMAFVQYQKSLQLDPKQVRLRYKMGSLFLEKRMVQDAQKEFEEVLRSSPDNALAYEGLGRASLLAGQLDRAEGFLREAIRHDRTLWRAYNLLGILCDRQDRVDEAIGYYQTAVTLRSNSGFLYNNLGVSLLLKGDNEKAVKAFREALDLDPSDSRIANNLGLALCRLGKYQEAFEAFRKTGDEASAHYNLGSVYLVQGKREEAIASFEKAIVSKPEFYARAYERLEQAKAMGLDRRPR